MALKGTIRDFGVADIFQLIGQQAKTGVLVMSNDVDEVRVYFRDGSVIRAENVTRPEEMLFGNLMVRAGALRPEQLNRALQEQRRTLKRLGAVLIDLKFATAGTVREFATLQTTETIYKLFDWKDGQYEFENTPVDSSPEGMKPISSETIVMNGVRMMDEWPTIRQQVPSYTWELQRIKDLIPPPSATSDLDFESSFGVDVGDVGPSDRLVYDLTGSRITIKEVIDRSRLGEFEACQAVANLMAHGYVRATKPSRVSSSLGPPPLTLGQHVKRGVGIAARIAVSAGLVVLLAGLLRGTEMTNGDVVRSETTRRHVAQSQQVNLRRSLEVFRLIAGRYPDELDELVKANIVEPDDLSFPFDSPYRYTTREDGFMLLPPIE